MRLYEEMCSNCEKCAKSRIFRRRGVLPRRSSVEAVHSGMDRFLYSMSLASIDRDGTITGPRMLVPDEWVYYRGRDDSTDPLINKSIQNERAAADLQITLCDSIYAYSINFCPDVHMYLNAHQWHPNHFYPGRKKPLTISRHSSMTSRCPVY